MDNKIICNHCNHEIIRSRYFNHLETYHYDEYLKTVDKIIKMNNEGYTIFEIAKKHNTTINVVFSRLKELKNKGYEIKEPLKISNWEPEDFKLNATTLWSFPERGSWATHNSTYRGNWSPYIPRNIILRYSREGNIVLDQFVGGGTTLIETKLLKRYGIGVDINKNALEITKKNTRFQKNNAYNPILFHKDARKLDFIKDETIDLICTHPPYANIIKYSEGNSGDLSLLDIEEFLTAMEDVAAESYRVLKGNKYCAILIGDMRRNKHMIPLGFRVMEKFLGAGFVLKETIIKEQHNCQATGFWYKRSIEYNFLLIAHEYLFVFRKP